MQISRSIRADVYVHIRIHQLMNLLNGLLFVNCFCVFIMLEG
jgi:hypothetical protein